MNRDGTPANVGSMEGLGGCIDESGNMFDGKEISLFSSTASEHNGEPMKFPLFRLLIVVVSCVFSPSSGQGGPLASRQGGQEFEVCRQMATEVFLQKHLSEVGWNIEELGETPAIGPAAVLQIYRILQEACSNAIKHANPKHLEFTLRRRAAEANRIEIVLKNDGRGFDSKAESKGGRGLSNMRRRALAIGAKFDIESDAQGSCVRLLLPAG